MTEWNAMTYEGKDTILRVVRHEAEQFFALAEESDAWDRQTACTDWTTRAGASTGDGRYGRPARACG